MTLPFTAEFLERRMAEHRHWQRVEINRLLQEVFAEMAEAMEHPAFRKRTDARLLPFPETSQPLVGRDPSHRRLARATGA